MNRKNRKLSLRARIYLILFGFLIITTCTYGFVVSRFITHSIIERLDHDYQNIAVDAHDTTQKLLWTLTLTSQQLLENEAIQHYLQNHYLTTNTYSKQADYLLFLEALSSLTMSNTDIALIHFYDTTKEETLYSTLPITRLEKSSNNLYRNPTFSFFGPIQSQSTFISEPVLTLRRNEILQNGQTITLSIETGYYSLSPILQSLSKKSAYLAYTNFENDVIYSTFPDGWNEQKILNSLGKPNSDSKFHSFSKQNSQGWTVHVVIPDAIYTQDYLDTFWDFTLITIFLVVLLGILSLVFWRSISLPLQQFEQQLPLVLSDEPITLRIHSTIPEYENLFNKINNLQKQIQDILRQAVEQEKLNTKIQLEKLRAQINPHFLLNTLNTLHWLALMNDQIEIDGITQSLSHLLSYNLDKDDYHSNLTKELDAITEYATLQKVRYHFNLIICTSGTQSDLNYPCPKFILQPLVENSLLHGYRQNMDIFLDIEISNYVQISVRDTGTGIELETLKRLQSLAPLLDSPPVNGKPINLGIGLQYVIQSLKDYCHGDYQFSINSVKDQGTEILLRFPKLKGGGYHD